MLELPAEDRSASPITGWTRAHWEAVADALLQAPRRYATPGHALIFMPGPASRSGRWSDGLEGFARTFLLAGFRLGGAAGADPLGLAEWYAEGIAAGVDPTSPERWPTLLERRQARVEAASIVIALHETRPWIWDRLSERTRQQVVEWLAGIVGTGGYGNNWIWFQNIVEAFLRTVGGPWSSEDIERNLELNESWYVGDGWYSDGGTQNFDYYSGWAMQFYPLWYCRVLGDSSLEATYKERLHRYLDDAQHLVGANGAPVYQGRSLTYRFAVLGPFWAGSIFDATPLESGRTKRIANGVLRYFIDNGSIDENGLLSIGWHRRFLPMRQAYTGPGSPYWGGKGFAGLLLPPDHPVWTETEQPLAVEVDDTHLELRRPGWIVSGTKADGIIRVINHGSDHAQGRSASIDSPFYVRHGYSTHSAVEASQGDTQRPFDSHVALLDAQGVPSHRTPLSRVDSEGFASRSRAHWLDLSATGGNSDEPFSFRVGPWLTTASVVRGPIEVRLARVDAPPSVEGDDPDGHSPRDEGPWKLHFGGWTIAADGDVESVGSQARTKDGLASVVRPLVGDYECGVRQSTGTNPLGEHSATPWARTRLPVEYGRIYAVAIALSGVDTSIEGVTVDVDGDVAAVRWPDAATDSIRLIASPPG